MMTIYIDVIVCNIESHALRLGYRFARQASEDEHTY